MNKNILILGIILILVVFVLFFFFAKYCIELYLDIAEIGTAYGILTAFFNALAIIGVVYTIYQSKRDTNEMINALKKNILQVEKQQEISTLSTLISIYEKKLIEEVSKGTNTIRITEIKCKISTFTKELENHLN